MIWYLFLSPINFALTNFFLKDGLHRASNSVWYFPIDKMICIKKSIVFLGLYSRKQELVINRDDLYENIFSDFVDPFRVYFGSCVDYTLLLLFNHFFDKNDHFSWKKSLSVDSSISGRLSILFCIIFFASSIPIVRSLIFLPK